jgi:hypothetical protein
MTVVKRRSVTKHSSQGFQPSSRRMHTKSQHIGTRTVRGVGVSAGVMQKCKVTKIATLHLTAYSPALTWGQKQEQPKISCIRLC